MKEPTYGECKASVFKSPDGFVKLCTGNRLCFACQKKAVEFKKEHVPSLLDAIVLEALKKTLDMKSALNAFQVPLVPSLGQLDDYEKQADTIEETVIKGIQTMLQFATKEKAEDAEDPLPSFKAYQDLVHEVAFVRMNIRLWHSHLRQASDADKYNQVYKNLIHLANEKRQLTSFETLLLTQAGLFETYEKQWGPQVKKTFLPDSELVLPAARKQSNKVRKQPFIGPQKPSYDNVLEELVDKFKQRADTNKTLKMSTFDFTLASTEVSPLPPKELRPVIQEASMEWLGLPIVETFSSRPIPAATSTACPHNMPVESKDSVVVSESNTCETVSAKDTAEGPAPDDVDKSRQTVLEEEEFHFVDC